MSLFQSFVFYHVIFASILWLLWLGSRNRTLANLGVLILILVSIFRFDIGNDYENYMLIIEDSKRLFQSCDSMWNTLFVNSTYFGIEPIFELLIWIFHVLDNTYLYVIGLYSLLFILIIYKVLEENGELFQIIREQYKEAYGCVKMIYLMMKEEYEYDMTEDEMLYLTIHIQKITEDHKRLQSI